MAVVCAHNGKRVMTERPEFLLRLRAEPSGVPVALRLRRALKYLLRGCELKCVSVEQVKQEGGQAGKVPTRPVNEE
jgi:hypothetical protein